MSRKHNTKHFMRGPSNYGRRLLHRGDSSASVRMPFIDRLGRRHDSAESLRRATERDAVDRGEVAA